VYQVKYASRVRSGERRLDGLLGSLSVSADLGGTLVVSVLVVRVLVDVGSSDLGLELLQTNSGEDSGLVYDRSIGDSLNDGDGGVNVGGLDGLPLDDGLDGLVDVVVNVLVGNGRSSGQSPLGVSDGGGVLVSVPLLLELLPVLGEHVVLGFTDDLGDDVVLVLGSQGLVVGDGLDTVLVVVDVPLTVDGLDLLDGLDGLDVLLNDGSGGLSADLGSVLLSVGAQEGLDVVNDSSGGGGRGVVGVGVGGRGRHF